MSGPGGEDLGGLARPVAAALAMPPPPLTPDPSAWILSAQKNRSGAEFCLTREL